MSESPSVVGGFAPATRDAWLDEVRTVLLRGRPDATDADFTQAFNRRLVTSTEDGLAIWPLYTSADAPAAPPLPGQAPFTRSTHAAPRPWEIRQRVWPEHPGSAVAELESGATGLLVETPEAAVTEAALAETLTQTLDGVLLDLAPVSLAPAAGEPGTSGARALLALWRSRDIPTTARRGCLGVDPVGAYARTGGGLDLEAARAEAAEIVRTALDEAPEARTLGIDGTVWHDAGATEAQELAWTMATAVSTIRDLVARGLPLDRVVPGLELRLAATADEFLTIAKFRAARILWARIAEAAGLPEGERGVFLQAETSRRMLTRYDTWVNVLRSTVACFGAGVGGADAVTVLPHDLLVEPGGSALGRRLARNTQTILQMESHLDRVVDPAGGSWYVESLTADLAAAAWALVTESERAGGIVALLQSGVLHETLAATRTARAAHIATRRLPLTGLSEFPDIDEAPPQPLPPRDACGDAFPPLVPHRLAEDFEEQRGRADAAARRGQRPTLYLATLGTPAEFTARLTFAKNLFEAAGIRTVAGTPDALDTDVTTVVCLCSSDEGYARDGAQAVDDLRSAGASRIYLAGRGVDLAGIDEEVGLGSDVLDILTRALDSLGVPR